MNKLNSDIEHGTAAGAGALWFRLTDDAPAQTRAFLELWRSRASGGLPEADLFDVSVLSMDYPLLVRVGRNPENNSLFWREVAATKRWPFESPVANRPVAGTSPSHTQTRVLLVFNEVLASGVPDYSEITSWMPDGKTVSVVRLVVPVQGASDRELLALWEVVQSDNQ